jgi:hypothetical protein
MAPELQEKVAARNRLQRKHAEELRLHAIEHRLVSQGIAKRKIGRSRRRLGEQVARSRQMAQRAKQRAMHIGECARKRARQRP